MALEILCERTDGTSFIKNKSSRESDGVGESN
jgi:hypothetical protein